MRGELHQRAYKPGGCKNCSVAFGGGEARDESDGCPPVKYVQIPPSSRSLLARQCE